MEIKKGNYYRNDLDKDVILMTKIEHDKASFRVISDPEDTWREGSREKLHTWHTSSGYFYKYREFRGYRSPLYKAMEGKS